MYLCSMYSVHLSAMSIFNRSFFDDVEVAETKIVAVVVANAPGVTRGEGGSRGVTESQYVLHCWCDDLGHAALSFRPVASGGGFSLEKIGIDEKVICYHNISN
jgi:hypothetical protein